MSKKKVEKELEVNTDINQVIEKMKKSLAGEIEKVPKEKAFTNIKKLKCDYTTYKEERTKYNVQPIETECAKCGKSFEAGEEIYTAFKEGKQGSCIICGNCAKGE